MMVVRTLFGRVALLATISASAQAQQLPLVIVSLEGGNGPHSMQAGATYFREEHSVSSVLAATVRLGQWGRVAPVVRVEREVMPRFAFTDDCPLAPNGSCREFFPQPEGFGAAAGAMVAVTGWLSAGGSVGRQWPRGYTRDFAEGRATVSPSRYFGLSGAIRRFSWNDPAHGRLWHRLHLVGIQAQVP